MKKIFKGISTLVFCLAISQLVMAQDAYQIGDTVTDFELKNTNGEMVSLNSFENVKGYLVVFTCNHCPFAVMYEDRLIDIHNKYGADYPIIAINPNDPEVAPEDSFDKMQIRAKEKGFEFNYVFDENQEIFPLFGAKKTPEVYLLDANKVIQYMGAIDDSPKDASAVEEAFLANAIEALSAGEEIKTKQTKAIGCSIKVKS